MFEEYLSSIICQDRLSGQRQKLALVHIAGKLELASLIMQAASLSWPAGVQLTSIE